MAGRIEGTDREAEDDAALDLIAALARHPRVRRHLKALVREVDRLLGADMDEDRKTR